MSTTAKTVLVIVVILVLAVIAWFAFMHGRGAAPAPAGSAAATAYPTQPATLPGGSSASDAALAKDAASIDANMSGLSTDNANVDQGLAAHTAP